MHRFLVPPGAQPGQAVALSPQEAAHAVRVLRLSPGEPVELSDGAGALWSGRIERADREGVAVRVLEALADNEPPVEVHLFQGLPKADKLELVAQKATELGAARLIPVRMERTVVKLSGQDGEKRQGRLQRICQEAAKQCGRGRVLQVEAPAGWAQALEEMRRLPLMLMPWEEASGAGLRAVRAAHPEAARIGVLIGPEGGISPREAQEAMAAGALSVTLGPRILRTETAALAALSLILYAWGDLGGSL